MTQFFYLPFQLPVFPCSSSTNMGQQDQITGPENRASRYHRCDRLLSPYNFHNGWIFFVGQATRHRLNLVLPFQRRSRGSDRRIVLLTRIFLSIFASEYRGGGILLPSGKCFFTSDLSSYVVWLEAISSHSSQGISRVNYRQQVLPGWDPPYNHQTRYWCSEKRKSVPG